MTVLPLHKTRRLQLHVSNQFHTVNSTFCDIQRFITAITVNYHQRLFTVIQIQSTLSLQSLRRNFTEDFNLHQHRLENLISRTLTPYFFNIYFKIPNGKAHSNSTEGVFFRILNFLITINLPETEVK